MSTDEVTDYTDEEGLHNQISENDTDFQGEGEEEVSYAKVEETLNQIIGNYTDATDEEALNDLAIDGYIEGYTEGEDSCNNFTYEESDDMSTSAGNYSTDKASSRESLLSRNIRRSRRYQNEDKIDDSFTENTDTEGVGCEIYTFYTDDEDCLHQQSGNDTDCFNSISYFTDDEDREFLNESVNSISFFADNEDTDYLNESVNSVSFFADNEDTDYLNESVNSLSCFADNEDEDFFVSNSDIDNSKQNNQNVRMIESKKIDGKPIRSSECESKTERECIQSIESIEEDEKVKVIPKLGNEMPQQRLEILDKQKLSDGEESVTKQCVPEINDKCIDSTDTPADVTNETETQKDQQCKPRESKEGIPMNLSKQESCEDLHTLSEYLKPSEKPIEPDQIASRGHRGEHPATFIIDSSDTETDSEDMRHTLVINNDLPISTPEEQIQKAVSRNFEEDDISTASQCSSELPTKDNILGDKLQEDFSDTYLTPSQTFTAPVRKCSRENGLSDTGVSDWGDYVVPNEGKVFDILFNNTGERIPDDLVNSYVEECAIL